MKIGDKVYWNDPDGGFSSGEYIIKNITGGIYFLSNGVSEAEALRKELSWINEKGERANDKFNKPLPEDKALQTVIVQKHFIKYLNHCIKDLETRYDELVIICQDKTSDIKILHDRLRKAEASVEMYRSMVDKDLKTEVLELKAEMFNLLKRLNKEDDNAKMVELMKVHNHDYYRQLVKKLNLTKNASRETQNANGNHPGKDLS